VTRAAHGTFREEAVEQYLAAVVETRVAAPTGFPISLAFMIW
jgi:hypothetical protein